MVGGTVSCLVSSVSSQSLTYRYMRRRRNRRGTGVMTSPNQGSSFGPGSFNRSWPSKNSHVLTSLYLERRYLMFGQGNRLILLIDICKGAVKLGPPPPLTAKVGTYVYFLANLFFWQPNNTYKVARTRGESRIWG